MSKIILLLSILISLNLCLKGQVLTSKNYYDNIIWECIPVQAKEFDTFAINYNMCGISDVTASISASRYGGFKDLNIYEGTGKIKRIDIEYFVLIDKFGVQEKLLQEKYLLSYNTVSQLLTRNRQTFVYANNRLSSVSPNSNTFSIANNIEGVKYEYDTKGLLSKIHTLNDDKLLYKRDEKNRVNKVIFEESRRGIARYTFVYEYANGTDYII